MNGWIGIDLDGTLAFYDHWRGIEHIGEPIPAMVEAMNAVRNEGYDIKVFTARMSEKDLSLLNKFLDAYTNWCFFNFGYFIPITNVKDFKMVELWDDRAVTVEHNTGKFLVPSTREFGRMLNEAAKEALERSKR